jgi:cell division initiation protein
MKLSPANIKRQEFSKVMRGYDVSEVAAFLERVAEEVEELQTQNDELKKDLEFANTKVTEFRRIEKNLQETLIKAQETSAKSMEAAKRQAGLILKDAEAKAGQIIERARTNSIEIRNAVDSLQEEKDVLLAKLKAIVNSQINIISRTFNEEGEPVELEQKRKQVQPSVDIDINDIINKISE